jgi:hypothetical protein
MENNLNLNDEIIGSLLDKSFFLDFIEITLTQLGVDDPVIFSGPGTISMNPSGVLSLKMYHSFKDIKKEAFPLRVETSPGKIMGDQHYFNLKGVDMKGDTWTSDKLQVSTGFSWPAAGKVIETTLREIVNQTERHKNSSTDKSFVFMLVAGKFDIPCNETEKTANGGISLNTTKFEIEDTFFQFKTKDNSLVIILNGSPEKITTNTDRLLLEALSIIFGKFVLPNCISTTHGDVCEIKIRSVSDNFSNIKITEPIKYSFPHQTAPFKEFITRYLETFDDPNSDMFGYWHKINRAWQAGIENAALAVTVAIEGVTKNYFKDNGLPDSEFIEQANEAKQKIKSLEIGKRIKERLLSSIGQSKTSNPKSSLFYLSEQGFFPKKLVEDWVELRNMSAHSDNLNEEEKQVYINNIFSCISLFYRLLFTVTKYSGKYIDFTTENWPEVVFKIEGISNKIEVK